jgi:hypothetical protein
LNANLALPYAVLGGEHGLRPPINMDAGLRMLDEALLRDPKETTALLWRAILNMSLGYFDRAKQDLNRCLQIDHDYGNCRRFLAVTALFSGDYAEAERLYEQNLKDGFIGSTLAFNFYYLDQGNDVAVLSELAYLVGREQGVAMVEPVFAALSDRNFEFDDVRANVEAIQKAFDGTEVDWARDEYMSFVFRNYAAIRTLDQSVMWFPYPEDYRRSPLRKQMIRDFGLFAHWQKHGFPPHCRPLGDDDFECD